MRARDRPEDVVGSVRGSGPTGLGHPPPSQLHDSHRYPDPAGRGGLGAGGPGPEGHRGPPEYHRGGGGGGGGYEQGGGGGGGRWGDMDRGGISYEQQRLVKLNISIFHM